MVLRWRIRPARSGAEAQSSIERLFEPHCEIAYCMGLIVGEGCFSNDLRQPSLIVALHASDPHPLSVLRGVFGGTIYGPYVYGIRQKRVWVLRSWQLAEALPYFDRWLPPSRKREQYEAWRERYWELLQRRLKFHVKAPRSRFRRETASRDQLNQHL
jgi:hypothetical protein